MIVSNNKKIIVLMNPKVGTQSINSTFSNFGEHNFDYINGHHESFAFLRGETRSGNVVNLTDSLDNYKIYCFYRNPIDRFISGVNHFKRTHTGFFKNFFYDRLKDINIHANMLIKKKTNYEMLPQADRAMIESISYIDVLNLFEFLRDKYNLSLENNKKMLAFFPQVNWIKSDLYQNNITLCDFRNFESELLKIIDAFGFDSSNVSINRINESIKYPTDNIIDDATKLKIRQVYKDDYDFFDSKGIVF